MLKYFSKDTICNVCDNYNCNSRRHVFIKKKNEKFLLHGSIVTIIFPIALVLPIAINFEKSFVLFHKLLFSNDYWMFDIETDPIILMLPEEFLCMQRVLFYYLFYVVA